MLILKDNLSIELFDIKKLERSIFAAVDTALRKALNLGGGGWYRSSPVARITATVTYLILKMGCACTAAEIRSFVSEELNIDERTAYGKNHAKDTGSDGVLPDVSAGEQTRDSQPA